MRARPLIFVTCCVFICFQDITTAQFGSQTKSKKVKSDGKQQETSAKSATGPLCDYNPSKADPTSGDAFSAPCASCISRSMVLGTDCSYNSWTILTRCTCTNYDFLDCKCKRVPSTFTIFAFFILPVLCISMICTARQCMKYRFCPLHSIEKDYKKWIKKRKSKLAKDEITTHQDQDADDEFDDNIPSTQNNQKPSLDSVTSLGGVPSSSNSRKRKSKL
eukprot:743744_1